MIPIKVGRRLRAYAYHHVLGTNDRPSGGGGRAGPLARRVARGGCFGAVGTLRTKIQVSSAGAPSRFGQGHGPDSDIRPRRRTGMGACPMKHAQCVEFLQWIMPRLGLDWSGFKRVHAQVCKRLGRRIADLGLPDFAAYRSYLLDRDTEWSFIDAACRITVSRFYRDAKVFEQLAVSALPHLAEAAIARRASVLRAWSAGCGAGEEPYSLALAWRFGAAASFPNVDLNVVATDVDEAQLMRADGACYRPGTLRELPVEWRDAAFERNGPLWCLRPEYRRGVQFLRQDIRADAPRGPFDLVLCRNLTFTYFDDAQRRNVLEIVTRELSPVGVLVIGRDERLPADAAGFSQFGPEMPIYRRCAGTGDRDGKGTQGRATATQ